MSNTDKLAQNQATPDRHVKIPSTIILLLIHLPVLPSSSGPVSSDTLQGCIRKSLLAADAPSWLSPPPQAVVLLQALRRTWAPRYPAPALPQSPPGSSLKLKQLRPLRQRFSVLAGSEGLPCACSSCEELLPGVET